MKIIFLMILYLLYFINCKEEKDPIIRIPNNQGIFNNITTKYGIITYEFHNSRFVLVTKNLYEDHTPYIIYKIQGMKNLDLLKLPKTTDLNRFIKKNNNLEFTYEYQEKDRHNPFICEIFYKTKYINKMIYSLGKDENGQIFKYFGGTPNKIAKNFEKFTFNNKTSQITEIKIYFNNNTNYIIDIYNKSQTYEIKEDFYSMICLPENMLLQFNELLFKDYKEYDYKYEIFRSYHIYKVTEEQKNLFPTITFKIENKIITLNKDDFFNEDINDIGEGSFLFINKVPCSNVIFGEKLLKLFDIREFNLENGEVNLYLNKSSNLIQFSIIQNNIEHIIILISIFVVSFITTLFKTYDKIYKNRKMEYYNYYLDF